ncbi:MAG: ABC transporter substrate-binding protein [Acidimicrobiaceae bacterium]|nr:ABC transporter substrate-binding protein [Acidimicrobiaceae bacterium]
MNSVKRDRLAHRPAASTRRRRGRLVATLLALPAVLASLILSGPIAQAQGTFKPQAVKHGGSMTILEVQASNGSWLTGLDPATSLTPASNMDEMNSIYGSLFELAGKTGQNIPDLATGYKVSKDGKTVQIFLRHGVKFSDGSPFNSSAVVFNWKRDFAMKANDNPSWPVTTTNPFTTSGPYTAVIHLTVPYTPLISTIHIHDVNWIVSPTSLAKMGEAAFKLAPVGAGPFVVAKDTPPTELQLKPNPNYWQKGLPYLDSLTFKAVSTDQSALDTLEAGQAQGYIDLTNHTLVPNFKSKFKVTSEESADPLDVQFNTTKPPFNNKLAREAVYYATDAATLNKKVYGGSTPLVQGITGPGGLFYHQKVPGYRTYNLAKAKAIVKQLGGLSFSLLGGATGNGLNEAEALQAMWKQAGMNVKLTLSPDLTSRIESFRHNNWQISPGGDGSWDPAGGVGVWFFFLSNSLYTGVHDPKLDALINKATQVPTEQRDAVYQDVSKYISDQALAVQLFPAAVWNVAAKNVYAPCLTTVCPTIETVPEVLWQYAGYTK